MVGFSMSGSLSPSEELHRSPRDLHALSDGRDADAAKGENRTRRDTAAENILYDNSTLKVPRYTAFYRLCGRLVSCICTPYKDLPHALAAQGVYCKRLDNEARATSRIFVDFCASFVTSESFQLELPSQYRLRQIGFRHSAKMNLLQSAFC